MPNGAALINGERRSEHVPSGKLTVCHGKLPFIIGRSIVVKLKLYNITGWWFGTFFIFPFSWECRNPN
jgi:hypothetical protein